MEPRRVFKANILEKLQIQLGAPCSMRLLASLFLHEASKRPGEVHDWRSVRTF